MLNGVTVQPSLSNVPRRPFRDRGASVRRRFRVTLVISAFGFNAALLMGAAALPPEAPATTATAAAAAAATTSPAGPTSTSTSTSTASSSPTPSPSPSPFPKLDQSSTFTFAAPAFSPTNAVRLEGTKDAGSSVVIAPPVAGGMPFCTIPASSSLDFSCIAPMASGRAIALSAVETLNGVASAPLSAMIDVLGAPTITGSPGYLTTGLVTGYGFAGSTVSTVIDGGVPGCSSVVTAAGYWSCSLTVPSGPHVVQVNQSRADLGGGASSSLSGSLSLVVDRDAPASAAITSPTAGSRVTGADVTFSGTGEISTSDLSGVADLYLDNAPACQTAVVEGLWSCSVRGVSSGAHSLLVIQRDAAGNYSRPSAPITVYFGAQAGSITPLPPPSPVHPSGPSQTPSAPPTSAAPSTPVPHSSPPAAPGARGLTDNWGSPTAFGATIPTLASSITNGGWLIAPLLALAFIVLIALPVRLLAGALRGRIRAPSLQLTGRNRPRPRGVPTAQSASSAVNPLVARVVPLAAAVGLIMVAGGVDDQVRYLRLTVAVMLGLGFLNVVGVVLVNRLGSRWQGVSGRVRFMPLLLIAALLAAAVSRATGIQPLVIAGVLIGIGFTSAVGARARAIVSLAEIGTVTGLAAVAWLLHGLIASSEGFWSLFAGETLATVALAGLGSVVVLVLPIATLPGRAVFEWSRPVWLAMVTVVALIGSVAILAGGGTMFPIVAAVLAAGGFAALSVAIWGWLRFVEPASLHARR